MKRLLMLGAALLAAELGAAAAPAPVLRWSFDAPDGAVVAPVTGKAVGKLAPKGNYEWVDGVSGKALHFGALPTGVMVPGMKFDFSKPFTAIAVVKLDPGTDKGAPYRAFKDIFGNTGTRGPGARLTIFYGGIQFNSGDGAKADTVLTRPAEYPVPTGRYFQIAVTYDGRTVTIYADGKKVAAKEMTVTASNGVFSIGAHRASAYPFPGAIDDLALYDCALPPETIAELALDRAE